MYAGPIAFVTVVLYWTVSMILGFALDLLPANFPVVLLYCRPHPSAIPNRLGSLDASIGSLDYVVDGNRFE